ncbi:GerAB/ArcD/ProY family transporter [Paenibacillus cremeus]|uniref:GerAB/ArcD/ProY family transporter n=1 Tax=Paenibacillus cremeus TaxID=2163881 RepID=A0A559K0B4_9BACL|nr:GerAB/ArcD/ProY family transporter [Paenibacillus cremeus]TVY05595.1 GerAB/ArcD/ProY family transporter [Paenibacillus cremeus]
MNRYFYYLVLTNMLVNVIAFVPRVLIRERYQGTVMAIVICAAIETLLMYLFINSVKHFPRKGTPEIFAQLFPGWLKNGLLFYLSFTWYCAGVITMLAFTDFSRKFLNPHMSHTGIIILYLTIVVLVCVLPSDRILYLLEILLVLSVPLIFFLLTKSFFNKSMNWDNVKAVAMYYNKVPAWTTISAGTYIFSGYFNIAIFNRAFDQLKSKHLWLAPLLGVTIMVTTISIPVGFLGSDAVGDYVFPWVSTADAMRIELGFIERVMFIFVFLYGLIAFASMIFHWHVSFELLKGILPLTRYSSRRRKGILYGCLAVYCASVLWSGYFMNDVRLFKWGELWLNIRLPSEMLFVGIMVYAARRLKN